MHQGVRPRMDDLLWTKRSWSGSTAYAESKFYDVALAFAISGQCAATRLGAD
jgi:hypothetical protein